MPQSLAGRYVLSVTMFRNGKHLAAGTPVDLDEDEARRALEQGTVKKPAASAVAVEAPAQEPASSDDGAPAGEPANAPTGSSEPAAGSTASSTTTKAEKAKK